MGIQIKFLEYLKRIIRVFLEWMLYCIIPSEPNVLRLVLTKASFDRKTEHPAVSQFLEYQLFWWRFERNFEKQEQRWRSLL